MRPITRYAFNQLPYEQQLAAVFETGTYLARRWKEEEGVNLHHLPSGFFVELYYDPHANELVQLRSFASAAWPPLRGGAVSTAGSTYLPQPASGMCVAAPRQIHVELRVHRCAGAARFVSPPPLFMALLACGDLRFAYCWPVAGPRAGPASACFPDATALDRGSGPAVLAFVNQVAALSGWTDPALGWKVEAMLRAMPPHVYTQEQAYAWVAAHWNAFAPPGA